MVYIGARDYEQRKYETAYNYARKNAGQSYTDILRGARAAGVDAGYVRQVLDKHPTFTGNWNLTAGGSRPNYGEKSIAQQQAEAAELKRIQDQLKTGQELATRPEGNPAAEWTLRRQLNYAKLSPTTQQTYTVSQQQASGGALPVSQGFYDLYQKRQPDIQKIQEREAYTGSSEYLRQKYFPYGEYTKTVDQTGKFGQLIMRPYGEASFPYHHPFGTDPEAGKKAASIKREVEIQRAGYIGGLKLRTQDKIKSGESLREFGTGALIAGGIAASSVVITPVGSGLLMGAWLGEKEARIFQAKRDNKLTAGRLGYITAEIPLEAASYGLGGLLGGSAVRGAKSLIPKAKNKVLEMRINRAIKGKSPKQAAKIIKQNFPNVKTKKYLLVKKVIGGKAVKQSVERGGVLKETVKYNPKFTKERLVDPTKFKPTKKVTVVGETSGTTLSKLPQAKYSTALTKKSSNKIEFSKTTIGKGTYKQLQKQGFFEKLIGRSNLNTGSKADRTTREVLNLRFYDLRTPKQTGFSGGGKGKTSRGVVNWLSFGGQKKQPKITYIAKLKAPRSYALQTESQTLIYQDNKLVATLSKGSQTKNINKLFSIPKQTTRTPKTGGQEVTSATGTGGQLKYLLKPPKVVTGSKYKVSTRTNVKTVSEYDKLFYPVAGTKYKTASAGMYGRAGGLGATRFGAVAALNSKSKLSLAILPALKSKQSQASVLKLKLMQGQGLKSLQKVGLRSAQSSKSALRVGQIPAQATRQTPISITIPKLVTTPITRAPPRIKRPPIEPPQTPIKFRIRLPSTRVERISAPTRKRQAISKSYAPSLWGSLLPAITIKPSQLKFLSTTTGLRVRPRIKIKKTKRRGKKKNGRK